MASSSSLQRSHSYLNCLQEEFDRRSNDTLSPRRFAICLGNLKGEFELLSLEVESLRKERDEYKEKVDMQMKKLQDVGRNFVCEQCSMGTTSAPRIAVPSKPETMKTARSWLSTLFFEAESLDKLTGVTRGGSTQSTLFQKLFSIITPTQTSQFISPHGAMPTKRSDTSSAASRTVTRSSQVSAPTVGPGSGHSECLIKFNNEVEKELDVEITHKLFHGGSMCCVKFSRDGEYLAAGCNDGKAYIYDVQEGTLTHVLRNLTAKGDRISAVCFSPDRKYLATGSWDGAILIWEINTKYVRNAFKGHARYIYTLNFSPNGRLLVSASGDNTVRLWNMHDGATKLLTEEDSIFLVNSFYSSADFSPNGRYVAASHRDGMVRIWDLYTGQLARRIKAHMLWANCVAFMPDGKGLVSVGSDYALRYWDVSSLDSACFQARSRMTKNSESHGETPGIDKQVSMPERQFVGHEHTVQSLAISSDGRWVASSSSDRTVRIWDTRTAVTQCTLDHNDPMWTVDFSPVGCYLASSGTGGSLKIWKYSNVASAES